MKPPGAGLGFAERSEEALNHPHGCNLSGGKHWLQHQGPRSSTDRCNRGYADGTNQLLLGALKYPLMGTRVQFGSTRTAENPIARSWGPPTINGEALGT